MQPLKLISTLLLLLGLCACGNKGPLLPPEEESTEKMPLSAPNSNNPEIR